MTALPDIQRTRLARPVRLVYWLLLLGGLALFTASRRGEPAVTAALWIGTIGGTLLGQYFALHNFRLWITAVCVAAISLYCAPMVWAAEASAQLWLSFIPAALCGFWSLGDRSGFAALWFPTVLWMLTVLDRSDRIAPEGPAALLLAALAALFVGFLCIRESRRVALWCSVAAEPLAPALPAELLREPPGRQLARVAWWLTVGALTAAITVWLVPPLWQSETLGGPPTPTQRAATQRAATQRADAFPAGLPCCPVHGEADTLSSRIKEYLDLGLGHDPLSAPPREGIDCRRCSAPAPSDPAPDAIATGPTGDDYVAWSGRSHAGTAIPGAMGPRGTVTDVSGVAGPAGGGGQAVAAGPGTAAGTPAGEVAGTSIEATVPADPDAWTGAGPSQPARPSSATDPGSATAPSEPARNAHATVPGDDPWSTPHTGAEPTAGRRSPIPDPKHTTSDERPTAPVPGDERPTAPIAGDERPTAPAAGDERPTAPAAGDERPAQIAGDERPTAPIVGDERPTAQVAGDERPTAPVPGDERPTAPAARDERASAAPAADRSSPATAPVPTPPAPASPPSETQPPPPPPGAAGQPTAQSRSGARLVGPSLLHWLAFAVVAAVVSQVVRLGLRPLRRLVTLRHLRRPFWDETIAQRVSNAWQLALIGLRDAGWRTGPSEPPRDLARRVGVDGIDRCATILERARHGVGLDAGDLAEIQSSADTAYRAARTGLGGLPRVLAWLRWPLT